MCIHDCGAQLVWTRGRKIITYSVQVVNGTGTVHVHMYMYMYMYMYVHKVMVNKNPCLLTGVLFVVAFDLPLPTAAMACRDL